MNNNAHFTFMALKPFNKAEDKRPNIMTKKAPTVLITQEIPRDLGVVSQEPWRETK